MIRLKVLASARKECDSYRSSGVLKISTRYLSVNMFACFQGLVFFFFSFYISVSFLFFYILCRYKREQQYAVMFIFGRQLLLFYLYPHLIVSSVPMFILSIALRETFFLCCCFVLQKQKRFLDETQMNCWSLLPCFQRSFIYSMIRQRGRCSRKQSNNS